MSKEMKPENHIVVFNDKKIRRVFHENAWWFVVTDVITALTDTPNASDYVKKTPCMDPALDARGILNF